jgi:uridine phosphorylase
MNITVEDLCGNSGIGRYILLPGSDGRAAEIAEYFTNTKVIEHPRCHNVYIGELDSNNGPIDVAVVATGMGAPSVDIIVNELFRLGGRRFIRVGTSGSLQPSYIRAGAVVIPTAAVRDEGTTLNYVPPGFPAVASLEMVEASLEAAINLQIDNVFYGTVHTKDSLYAREFKAGPLAEEHRQYVKVLKEAGVLASEMECSLLFTLGAIMTQELKNEAGPAQSGPADEVLTGAVLGVIGDDSPFADSEKTARAIKNSIEVGLETIRILAKKNKKENK